MKRTANAESHLTARILSPPGGFCCMDEILPTQLLQTVAERICLSPVTEHKSGAIPDPEAFTHEREERNRLRVVECGGRIHTLARSEEHTSELQSPCNL